MIRMARGHASTHALVIAVVLALLATHGAANDAACTRSCPSASLPADCTAVNPSSATDPTADLVASSCLAFGRGTYTYRYVNVLAGGVLWFVDDGGAVEMKANSILVEQGGRLVAGQWCRPFGCAGGNFTISLWGDDPTKQGTVSATAIQCKTPGGCYPAPAASSKFCCNGIDATSPCAGPAACNVSGQNSAFEGYGSLPFDGDGNSFGFKVLALSYGGSIKLFGRHGVDPRYFVDPATDTSDECETPSDPYSSDAWAQLSGQSWARLNATAVAGATSIVLDRPVNWRRGDKIAVGTTDWYASHTEHLTVAADAAGSNVVQLSAPLQWNHFGDLSLVDETLRAQAHNPNKDVDTRAVVGLLTRSITIRSLGATADAAFPEVTACGVGSNDPMCYFGGHTIVRQGFAKYEVQGVEFRQLGQGGRMAHYPIHWHLAKETTYTRSFVRDSSSWDSMTRFAVVHGTHNVELSRNVGYLSVGHGFYLEDSSEINNRVCHNLAVALRAPLMTFLAAQPPNALAARKIPAILPSVTYLDPTKVQGGDEYMPTAFWIMNAWNDIVGNTAIGVHGFGTCFWLLGSELSGPSRYLLWASKTSTSRDYAQWHKIPGRLSPVKRFRGNSCGTAYNGLQTSIAIFPVTTADAAFANGNRDSVPRPAGYTLTLDMVPIVTQNFQPTRFSNDAIYQINDAVTCTKASLYRSPPFPGSDDHYRNPLLCSAAVIDRFRTSFNWAEVNFGSVWLRGLWFLVSNAAITDQLFGGVGFVTGGSWLDAPPGFWMLASNSIFIGRTQTVGVHASHTGPVLNESLCWGSGCPIPSEGTAVNAAGLQNSRLITIYDGPFFADGNIFLNAGNFSCNASFGSTECGVYRMSNQPQDVSRGANSRYMTVTSAAIGWKQPNGFYYPPAFSFRRSAFDDATLRHTVIDITKPYLLSGPKTEPSVAGQGLFNNVRSIDASTILIDEDGTLTGVVNPHTTRTTSLSSNTFFNTPPQVPECRSFGVQTTPFEALTTVITTAKRSTEVPSAWRVDLNWALINPSLGTSDPSNFYSTFPFVPIYRQVLQDDDTMCEADVCASVSPANGMFSCTHAAFMAGSQEWSAPYLTMDKMTYYIDTRQQDLNGPVCSRFASNFRSQALFQGGNSYVLYQLYPQKTSSVTYQVYVGEGFDVSKDGFFARVFATTYLDGDNKQQAIVPAPSIKGSASVSNGVLTVTLDNALIAGDFDIAETEPWAQCMPRDVCEPNPTGTGCVVSRNVTDPQLRETLAEVCEYWVTRASGNSASAGSTLADCPNGGCLAFVFTLPANFSPKPYADVGLPLVKNFTCEEPWGTPLVRANTTCANDCDATPNGYCAVMYRDADGDGYGDSRFPSRGVRGLKGFVARAGDCNDNNASVHPGAAEVCDGVDNDCDGHVDEDGVCGGGLGDSDPHTTSAAPAASVTPLASVTPVSPAPTGGNPNGFGNNYLGEDAGSSGNGLSTGAIVGIAVGTFAAGCLVAAVGAVLWAKSKGPARESSISV